MKSRRVLVVRIDSAYRLAASAATRGWMCFRCFGRGGVPYVRGSIDKWIVDLSRFDRPLVNLLEQTGMRTANRFPDPWLAPLPIRCDRQSPCRSGEFDRDKLRRLEHP
jgi:hypothetical protein